LELPADAHGFGAVMGIVGSGTDENVGHGVGVLVTQFLLSDLLS
jgi:hypothetical protein